MRSNYLETNSEEDIALKNQFRIKNIPEPISIREVPSKHYVDNRFNDLSTIKNGKDIDFNDKNLEKIKFIKVNYQPDVDTHLTPKIYVDNVIDETYLLRNYQDNKFSNNNLTRINSFTLNTQAVNDNQVNIKAYVDQFLLENEQSRRNLGIDSYNESSDLVEK